MNPSDFTFTREGERFILTYCDEEDVMGIDEEAALRQWIDDNDFYIEDENEEGTVFNLSYWTDDDLSEGMEKLKEAGFKYVE